MIWHNELTAKPIQVVAPALISRYLYTVYCLKFTKHRVTYKLSSDVNTSHSAYVLSFKHF